ncbi:MAG: LysE family transporter, partial [Candidatus Eremiobacteraeota bacterium]|nr:LysE family transporter [Candidatus Eremiobacteraeota bacterium]
ILAKEKDVPAELSPQTRAARGWANGTVVQLSNPKALIFFTAILPQFIDPRGNVLVQIVILGFAGLAVELGVLSVYVLAANRLTGNGMAARRHVWVQRVGGAFLLGVAAAVAREF